LVVNRRRRKSRAVQGGKKIRCGDMVEQRSQREPSSPALKGDAPAAIRRQSPGGRHLAALGRDDRGSMLVITALVSTVLIGMVGLAIDVGMWYRTQRGLQNAADSAAVAAALNGGSTYAAEAQAVAARYGYISGSNGVSVNALNGQTCPAPNQSDTNCYTVTISLNQAPQFFSKILGIQPPTLSGTAGAGTISGAGEPASADACIIALSTSGTGVTLSGGTSVSAPNCAVASNQTFNQGNCGPTITTAFAGYYSGSPPFNSSRCSAMIVPPSGTSSVKFVKQMTADPLKGASGVTGATSRLSSVASLASPSGPSNSSGSNISFGYSPSSFSQGGCSFTLSGSTWTGACSGSGPFSFGNVTLSGGITVNFNTSGSSSATYNFNQITNSGTALNFGPGTFNIAQGINLSGGGATTSFGAGTFNIGLITASCSGPPSTSTDFSICMNGKSLTFGGPSTFVLAGGIWNKGGETLTLGSGSSNSFNIGAATDGYSIYVGGGSTTTFADATGSGDLFQTAGSIASSGGSCLYISAAAEHDINGFVQLSGGLTMGAGVYSLTDYFDIGGSSGGDVTCSGSSIGILANGVTVVLKGAVADPNCSTTVFCVGNGFGHVTLVSPSSGATENLAVIGPTSSSNTNGALFTQGSTNTSVSGAFYFPHGAITLNGAAEVGNGSGECLELIGSQVTLSGGSALASSCSSLGQTAVGGSVVLVR
jgi:hypothetical protein